MIVEAVYEKYGKRCLDYDEFCQTCRAWAEVDAIHRAAMRKQDGL